MAIAQSPAGVGDGMKAHGHHSESSRRQSGVGWRAAERERRREHIRRLRQAMHAAFRPIPPKHLPRLEGESVSAPRQKSPESACLTTRWSFARIRSSEIGAGSENYLPARLMSATRADFRVYGLGDQVAGERAE